MKPPAHDTDLYSKIEQFLLVLVERSHPASLHTINSYRQKLTRLANWLGHTGGSLSDLGGERFTEFLDSQAWGMNSRRLCTYAARSFVRWRYGVEHPLLSFNAPRPKPRPQRTLTIDEGFRILASVDTSTSIGRRDLALLTLAFDTGLRAFEILKSQHSKLPIRTSSLISRGLLSTERGRGGELSLFPNTPQVV